VKRFCLLTLLAILLSSGASALEWKYWDLDLALTWEYNAQLDGDSDGKQPSKLMFNPGASGFADFDGESGAWYFRPGGWLSWNIEDVYKGISRPAGEELIDHMKVLGLMADVHFGYLFELSGVDVGVQAGPSLYLKFPLWTAQEGTAEPAEFWKAYYGAAQFINIGLASWAAFEISETTDGLVGLRFYLPVSNLWTAAPFSHQIMVSLTGSVRFHLVKDR